MVLDYWKVCVTLRKKQAKEKTIDMEEAAKKIIFFNKPQVCRWK